MIVGDWVVVREGMEGNSYGGYAGRLVAVYFHHAKIQFILRPTGFIDMVFERWIPFWDIRLVTKEEYYAWLHYA
ncbi:hypothetical protein [Paenibacillus pini]|uniref:hypothetical protein n=1 Tax=Paenibacillus pini TaxID=669461 RepID=UPI000562D524|nr:hypothetical protein [Paenibacillus pini]